MTSSIAVRRDGDAGAGVPVVLVHGAMDRAVTFAPTQRALTPRPTLAYDRRGYGGSVGLGAAPPSVSAHVSDLLDVIGDTRAIIIGHSFGGLVALAGAAFAPERILAVGVYEPPMPWQPFWPASAFRDRNPATAAESFFHQVVGGGVWESVSEEFRRARRAEGHALVSDFMAAEAGLPFEFADILSPVATATGTASPAWYRESARTIASEVHGATLTEIAGAAHGIHMSHPDAFAAWISTVAEAAVG